jgi:hypothetical protein
MAAARAARCSWPEIVQMMRSPVMQLRAMVEGMDIADRGEAESLELS